MHFMDLPPGSGRAKMVLKGVLFCYFDLIGEEPVHFCGVIAYLIIIAVQGPSCCL